MSRGLGKLQKKILNIIENGCAVHRGYLEIVNGKRLTYHGWTDVHELIYYVVNGFNCWNKLDKNDDEFYDSNFELNEPTIKDQQSIWRAIRMLEKRGIIESRLFLVWREERVDKKNYRQSQTWGNYKIKRGCANKQKAIRLAQKSNRIVLNT